MSRTARFVTARFVLLFLLLLSMQGIVSAARGGSPVEAGPENGGLRLRFTVRSLPRSGEEAFDVQLDIINTTEKPITLLTGWESTEPGDVKQYLTAAANIETTPRLARLRGATGFLAERTEPQKQQVLGPQETLTLQWQTARRTLKNESLFFSANPEFTQPGLYSVHVNLNVITGSGTIRLRSNEQLVSIGGSRSQPKATCSEILKVSPDRSKAEIDLGTFDKVAVGDRFDISSKLFSWRLTITEVGENSCAGTLEKLSSEGDSAPMRGDEAILIEQSARRN
jgi:hypothetical protein